MFGGRSVQNNKELTYKANLYRDIFKVISKDIAVYGMWKKNCKKCEPRTDENMHINHCDKDKSNIAKMVLDKLIRR
jgi:hypothetical protein